MKKFSQVLAGLFVVSFWSIAAFAQGNFIRGDANCDGTVDSSDISAAQSCVFVGACPCQDAVDFNDDGFLAANDVALLINFLNSGGAPPRPPFPECGTDPTPDGLTCVGSCCLPQNHYKTWRVFDLAPPVFRTVFTQDQFLQDFIQLDTIHFLSNPTTKDAHPIIDPDDHLTWYRARGAATLLEVEFVNQFQRDTVLIDSLRYFLVPTQKSPHPPYDSMDHYKAYRIRNPQMFSRPTVNMQDQFMPEFVNQFIPRYFLTPTRKNAEPVYDTTTHYVAYEFFPKRILLQTRQTLDQFGFHNIRVDTSYLLLVPTLKLSFQPPSTECSDGIDNDGDGLIDFPADCGCADPTDPTEAPNPLTACSDGIDNDGDGFIDFPADPGCANVCDDDEGNPPPAAGPNHYKTWRTFDISMPVFRNAFVQDQFMQDFLRLDTIQYLSNPAVKVVDGNVFDIVDPDDHLTWYRATGRDTLLRVVFRNQFTLQDTVTIDSVRYLLVPTQKSPHPPYDSLDHYKAYRIRDPQPFSLPVQLQDQFDATPEFINLWVPRYFLTPAQKNTEPTYDTTTHYLAYEFFPKRTLGTIRQTQDQFGPHNLRIDSSVFLLVPTDKVSFCRCDKGDINCDGNLSPADVVCLLTCVYTGGAAAPCVCDPCVADVDCNGTLSPSDVVLELNRVYLGLADPPWCGI